MTRKRLSRVFAWALLATSVAVIALKIARAATGGGPGGLGDLIFGSCDNYYLFLLLLIFAAYAACNLRCLNDPPEGETQCFGTCGLFLIIALSTLGLSYFLCIIVTIING